MVPYIKEKKSLAGENPNFHHKHFALSQLDALFVPFENQSRVLPGEAIASVPQRSLSGIANESNAMGLVSH